MSEDLESVGKEALEELDGKKSQRKKTKTKEAKDPEDMTDEELQAVFEQKKARVAQVLTRGMLNEKLRNAHERSVPEGYMGKFVRDTEDDIVRYENIGYGFTYTDDAKGAHGDPADRVRVGDVVLMTIKDEDAAVLRAVRRDKIQKNLSKGRDLAKAKIAEGEMTPTFDESQLKVN